MKQIDIKHWKRKSQYDFFIGYTDPVFNVTANIDVTNLRAFTKERGLSYFLASLHVSTKAANFVEEFRYRIRDEQVIVHDVIHAGSTYLLEDETFTFAYFDYCENLIDFCKSGSKILEKCKTQKGLETDDNDDSLIFYSVLPWISFTSLKNPSQQNKNQSIPKIVFGKYFPSRNPDGELRLLMPVSVEAHHALMDGFHLGRYYQTFQSIVDKLND